MDRREALKVIGTSLPVLGIAGLPVVAAEKAEIPEGLVVLKFNEHRKLMNFDEVMKSPTLRVDDNTNHRVLVWLPRETPYFYDGSYIVWGVVAIQWWGEKFQIHPSFCFHKNSRVAVSSAISPAIGVFNPEIKLKPFDEKAYIEDKWSHYSNTIRRSIETCVLDSEMREHGDGYNCRDSDSYSLEDGKANGFFIDHPSQWGNELQFAPGKSHEQLEKLVQRQCLLEKMEKTREKLAKMNESLVSLNEELASL